jgi:hypothetical protein
MGRRSRCAAGIAIALNRSRVAADGSFVRVVRDLARNSRVRLVANAVSIAVLLAVATLAVRHFASAGWPLAGADPRLVAGAGVLFLLAYAFKACGWQQLFVPEERPTSLTLAAAAGAASVGGTALPGRVDDAIRVAFVRRFSRSRAGVGTLCLSLFVLGLIDTVALMPFASAAAATGDVPVGVRAGLAVVAFAGLGAAGVVLALPRLSDSRLSRRFQAARWLAARATCTRDAWKATVLISLSWLVRTAGLVLLLAALGIGLSLPLAMVFLCAAAASGALPIAPAGAATQVGAGAGALVASGLSTGTAIAVAVAAQALVVLAGAAVLALALAWAGGRRLVAPRPATA